MYCMPTVSGRRQVATIAAVSFLVGVTGMWTSASAQVCDAANGPISSVVQKPGPLPPSVERQLRINRVPQTRLAAMDVAGLLAEDAVCPGKCARIGVPRDVTMSLQDGVWTNVADGRIWSADLIVEGAVATRVHLTNINLPKGATLMAYRPDGVAGTMEIAGPYEGTGLFADGQLWTPEISGERVRFEIFLPPQSAKLPQIPANMFTVDSVQHIYRDPMIAPEAGGGTDTPTNCADVTCYGSWASQARAVARITYVNGGTFLCTGQLLQAQNGDLTPYFLTANHCISSNAVANTATFYWLYQSSTCNGAPPAIGSVPTSNVATLLSTGAASDYTLLMIEGALPCNLYWLGWDANVIANATGGACISHPGGTWKRIALGAKWNAFGCGGANHIGVSYAGGPCGTEPGSSGGAFIIPARGGRVIGQLHCGPSSCESATTDDYGAFNSTYPNVSGLLAGGSDDGFGNNHTCATAAVTGSGNFNGLVVKSTAEDWYRVTVGAGQQITVSLSFTHAYGDIDTNLFGTCGGASLASSTSTSNSESFTYVNTGATANFYVHVYLYPCDTRNQYNMSIAVATPAPLNNNCASAFNVGLGTYSYTTIGATTDGPNEPTLCTNAGDTQVSNDVWYKYTAQCTGVTRVSLCNSNYDTKMAIYGSSCPAGSAAIACNDDFCGSGGLSSEVTFNTTAGLMYIIRIGGYNGATGNGTMVISCAISNACSTAINIGDGTYPFNTTGMTTDGPDEPGLCSNAGDSQVSNDIWYRYTAECTGNALVSLCGSAFDTKVAIYDANCPSGSAAIACNDDSVCGLQSQLVFPTTAGFQYLIRIGGYNGATGAGTLRVSCPYNDLCADAPPVGNGAYAYTNDGAATDGPDEPTQCNYFSYTQVGSDVWYRYTATCNSTVTIKMCSSNYDSKVAVYGATCPVSSSAVVCNDDACGFGTQSRVSFSATSGNQYLIRIGGYLGAMGAGTLVITCCNADINGDGQVNVIDLLAVINAWGACAFPPTPCLADINGDLNVNVADLLAVINGWGPCP